jgi:hypothetical protein
MSSASSECPADRKASDGSCLSSCPDEWKLPNGGCVAPELRNAASDPNADVGSSASPFLTEKEVRKNYPSSNPNYYANDTCGDDILDMNCHKGLKTLIWTIIGFSIVFLLIFIYYVIQAIIMSMGSETTQTVKKVVETVQEKPSEADVKAGFFDRLFGSKTTTPVTQPKSSFFDRMFGRSN